MYSNKHTIITISRALLTLGYGVLVSNHALAANCTDVSGTTVTITENCRDLEISGDGSNVTINSGIIIDAVDTEAVINTGSTTNTTITNNGKIDAGHRHGVRNYGHITELVNNVTIKAGFSNSYTFNRNSAVRNDSTASITSITNTGTFKAFNNFGLKNLGTIGTITNSGTISSGAKYGLGNKGSIDTITNSGTISAKGKYGLYNYEDATITKLNNSGTISSETNYAINNFGSIVTLTNTGSLSPTGSTGISNAGTITTFNNSQGKSGSDPVTFTKKLPTNYNVIVNSTSDYGQIVFSNVSGTTTFGIDSSSTLANDTTYSSVLSGLSSDDIASGTSGTIASPDACNDVSGTTITVSANCADLDISGTDSNVTINSGVTLSGEGDKNWTLNNSSGTLWDLVVSDDDDVVNTGTGTVITNSGTIFAVDDNGLLNETSASITTLTNSGTITAADNYGLYNKGTITTLTNTGTISASGNNIGVYNTGTITTLNNSQGASGSALTYDGTLPTNYNVIVNSTSDYGQIVFSNVSGTINFGIDSSSTLADVDTTYSSVLSGLSSGDIASGTSGIFGSGALKKEWVLNNISGSLWDLAVTVTASDDTNTSVTTKVKPNVILGINYLNSVLNFANMNTYDCNLFDKNNGCISLGGRYTAITNPKTQTYIGVLTGGYKLSDKLRVAGFFHRNFSQKTPKSFKLSDKTPLLGGLVVWNENANKLGYQLKLANAFQQKNAALTREVIGSSEEGKGQTVIEAQSYMAELQYAYQLNDDTVYQPYLAVRRALIKQHAYTETGVSSPLSFNKIEDKSIAVLLGLKFNRRLSTDILLKGSLGVEHDISHTVDRLEPTGISGLTTVNLDESFNETRPVVSIGFEYNLTPNQRLASIFQYQELPYQSKTASNAYLYYTIGF